jgi:hypothetical protein
VVLQEIERDPSFFIHGDDLAVKKRIFWKPFAGTGDSRELISKKISSS